jgi:hypothetical protein
MKFAPTAFSITSYAFHVEQLLNGSGMSKLLEERTTPERKTPRKERKQKEVVPRGTE